jgi:uncharacterized protein (TIGR02302 family)
MAVKLERTIRLARLALIWEAAWSAVFPALLVLAVLAIAVFSGLLAALPDLARFTALGFFALALLWSLRPIISLRLPSRTAALRRVELASQLDHRPISAITDRLAAEFGAAQSRSIWDEHILRQLARLARLKAGVPESALKRLDPYALRLAAGLGLIAVIFLHRGDPAANLADALRVAPAQAQATMSLDAWIRPPAYTAKSPVMLTSPAIVEKLKRDGEVVVPENSDLVLRLAGARNPRIAYYEPIAGPDSGQELKDQRSSVKTDGGTFQVEARLARPVHVRVSDDSGTIADWRIALVPDAPPSIAFTSDPASEPNGALQLAWKAKDDYGIAGITARIALADEQEDGLGIEGNGVFLFEPPQFPIQLKRAAAREIADTSVNDLTEHAWAGLTVNVTLEAKDQAGQVARSEVKIVKLPEREFHKPLARALIEQRRALIFNPDDTANVLTMLDGLLTWPDGVIEKSGVQIAISAVRSHIAAARDHDDIRAAIDTLWQIATSVEEGDIADARAELEQIRKELEQALAEGAPPEKIAALMDKLRQAMDRYLQSMAEEARRRMEQQGGQTQPMRPGRMVTPQDLQKMLDRIEKLARNGAKEAAQELLAQLDNILRNLEPGMAGNMDPPQDSPLSQMLDELTDLMRRQQQLMDDTQKMPGGENGEPSGDPYSGERGQPGNNADKEALAAQQDALRRLLDEMMGRLGEQGMRAPPTFGEAGKSMEGATGSLRQGARDPALEQQGQALSKLREGAQNMARQMMQQGTGSTGNYGRHGEARGDDRDPLGRPYRTTGEDYGPERNMLPSEMAIRRAREILDMLRSRANIPDLPRIDRDYIDRLLRGLY